MKVYRIRNWNKHFENNRTRDLKRMEWVPIPNKHDGDGYTELLDHQNGLAHYGAWCLLIQVASKCGEVAPKCGGRGTLLREGAKPYDATSLARVTRSSQQMFEEAIPRLVLIGWLEVIDVDDKELPTNPAPSCGETAPRCVAVPMEWNGMERKGTESTHIARVNFAIPANEAEAVEFAAKAGVAPDFAKALYHQCEGRGWVDGSGNQIQMWSSYAKGRFLKEAFNNPPTAKGKSATRPDHRSEKAAREFPEPDVPLKRL